MPLLNEVPRQNIERGSTALCIPYPLEWVRKNRKRFFRKPRTFAVSYQLGLDSAPTLFESRAVSGDVELKQVYLNKKSFVKAGGKEQDYIEVDGKAYVAFRKYLKREWVEISTGELVYPDDFLRKYTWRWSGHFNTYLGQLWKNKKRKAA